MNQLDDKSQKNKNTKYDNHVSKTNGKWYGVSMNKIHLSEYKCPSDTARNRTIPQYTIGSAIPNKSTGTNRTPELPNHDCQILEWPENRNNDYRSHQGNQAHRNADLDIVIERESARSQYEGVPEALPSVWQMPWKPRYQAPSEPVSGQRLWTGQWKYRSAPGALPMPCWT